MRIIICDDLECLNVTRTAVEEYFSSTTQSNEMVYYEDAQTALGDDGVYDLAFLDVEMGTHSGIEIARHLKKANSRIVLFIITAYGQYLDDAFDLNAFRFLEKPVDKSRLFRSLDAALSLYLGETIVFTDTASKKSIKLASHDIIFVENYHRKTRIVTLNGEFISKEHIDFWEGMLNAVYFTVPHKSYIVNMNFIESFSQQELFIKIKDGREFTVPIASRRQPEVRKTHLKFVANEF